MSTAPSAPTPDEHVEPDLPLPQDFDLDAWFKGVRSTVRSCTIYQRADLLAEIEDTERRLQLLEAGDVEEFSMEDTGDKASLNARIQALYQELMDSGVTFKVEGRSADWIAAKEKEVNRDASTHGMSKEQKAQALAWHQLADAIIQPTGITVEHMRRLEEVAGAQYRKLWTTFLAACSQAPAVSAPTSPSSSARRGGRGR